jgi:hypothetical protein
MNASESQMTTEESNNEGDAKGATAQVRLSAKEIELLEDAEEEQIRLVGAC